MEFRTDGLLVILEDEKSYLKELFDKNPTFAEKFTSEISIPIMTNDELVTFGKSMRMMRITVLTILPW